MKSYKVTYRLYGIDYAELDTRTVITPYPFEFIENLKDELQKTNDLQLGSYVVEPIAHLTLVK